MGDDLDDMFADEAAKKARPVGKFQPKAKVRPQRKGPATTSVASSQAVQTIDSAPSELSGPIETAKLLEQSSKVVPNDNADLHGVTKIRENADVVTRLEALDDFLPQTTTDKECSVLPSAEEAPNVPNSGNIGGRSGTSALSSIEDSTRGCEVADVPTDPGMSADVNPIFSSQPIVSSADVDNTDTRNGELRVEGMDVVDSINMTELSAISGQRTGKSQRQTKLPMKKRMQTSESVSDSLGSQYVPPEVDCAEKDSVSTSQQDDVLDPSSLDFTHTLPTERTSEHPFNEESMNHMEVAQLDSCIHLEDLPEIPAKLASRRAKTGNSKIDAASDPSPQKQKASTSSQENGTGRSLRPRKGKTNLCEPVDEDRDEVLATGEISEECPPSSPIVEENINNEEIQVESASQKKKLKRKSKKTDDGKEKPARKSKKAKEASDLEGSKKKKFSHSTRRRRVDQILLETPEDEIDHHKVPLRDLILLAEHREREMKRGNATEGATATNPSTGNSSGLNNDENCTSVQDGEYNDGQQMVDTTEYFNYQTHMDKTPTKRWSKQETELFYEAIQQFGTDLSMIQLRFPGRSRRQVKLKYKKEERQHPLRLREALTNRSEDLSHFQMAIEHLRKVAAEENQNVDKDELVDLTDDRGAEDEGTSNANDDEAKDEHVEEEEIENVANDLAEGGSHLKPDDDDNDDEDDDFMRWSQYKSDI